MTCPECGHALTEHRHDRGCKHPACLCWKSPAEIELQYWKAEAMTARELLDALVHLISLHFPNDTPTPKLDALFTKYLLARVGDETK